MKISISYLGKGLLFSLFLLCTQQIFAQSPSAKFSVITSSGSTVSFTSHNTVTPASYSWSFPGGNPSASTDMNPVISYSDPGDYTASLTVSNGEGSSTSSASFTVIGETIIINLSTGSNDDGTLMSTSSIPDPDWTFTRTNGTEGTPYTRQKANNWCNLATTTDWPGINSIYITEGTLAAGTYYYTSKSFTIPENSTNAQLKFKATAWRRHNTYLVKINQDGSTTETLISQTTGQGHFCTGSPAVNVALTAGTYRVKVKITSDDNVQQRNATSINSFVSYDTSANSPFITTVKD